MNIFVLILSYFQQNKAFFWQIFVIFAIRSGTFFQLSVCLLSSRITCFCLHSLKLLLFALCFSSFISTLLYSLPFVRNCEGIFFIKLAVEIGLDFFFPINSNIDCSNSNVKIKKKKKRVDPKSAFEHSSPQPINDAVMVSFPSFFFAATPLLDCTPFVWLGSAVPSLNSTILYVFLLFVCVFFYRSWILVYWWKEFIYMHDSY